LLHRARYVEGSRPTSSALADCPGDSRSIVSAQQLDALQVTLLNRQSLRKSGPRSANMHTACAESPAGPPAHLPSVLAVQDSAARPRIDSGLLGIAPSHAPFTLSNSEDPGLAPEGAGEIAITDRTGETSSGLGPSLQFTSLAGKGRVPELKENHSFRNGKVSPRSCFSAARLCAAATMV
jgi:hypothetical protein